MKIKGIYRICALLMALFIVSLSFASAASAKAEITWYEQVLEYEGINVNDLDIQLTNYEKIGDEIHYSGIFKIDVEKEVNKNIKKLDTKGSFSGIIKADGSEHSEYSGDNFNFVMDTSKVDENQKNVSYKCEQSLTIDGKIIASNEVIEVPKEQIQSIDNKIQDSTNNDKSISALASKRKIDLPSTAPWGSRLIYNNVKYSNILGTAQILAAILAFFNLGTSAGLAAIAVAVASAIPGYYNVDPANIYIDFFLTLTPGMYCEVDYFYV